MTNEQQRTKKIFLDAGFDYDFVLFGIMSDEKFHRLVWLINKTLSFQFSHSGELDFKENEIVTASFTKYEYTDEINHLEFTLLQNKDNSIYLIPELRTINFFIIMKGALDFVDLKSFTDNLKLIDSIQLISEIDHQKLKSKQNLIF